MNQSSDSPRQAAKTRKTTRRFVYVVTAFVVILTAIFLLWSLRTIILPFIIGTFVAYLCFPLLKLFTRTGLPRPAGILLLFAFFFIAVYTVATQIGSVIPDDRDRLVLRTRFQYKLNERYNKYMEMDKPGARGNIAHQYFGKDFDRFMDVLNGYLRFNAEEREQFLKYREGYGGKPPIEDRYYGYFLKNSGYDPESEHPATSEVPEKKTEPGGKEEESRLSSVMAVIKLWIIMPLVFLFLLIDDGEIRRFFIGLVPNRYFEVSLAVTEKVNRAIGNYLRGILTESMLVALSYIVLFSLIGFDVKIAVAVGLLAGIANAIPMLGVGIAFVLGSSYALIAESSASVLPFINAGNLIVAVAAVVLLVFAMDNAVFQPFVVGGAVKLHPLVVFVGIIGGSMLFGFAGLILAIPTIVVVKEFSSTLFRELKNYYII